jgi:hypothetical protein
MQAMGAGLTSAQRCLTVQAQRWNLGQQASRLSNQAKVRRSPLCMQPQGEALVER